MAAPRQQRQRLEQLPDRRLLRAQVAPRLAIDRLPRLESAQVGHRIAPLRLLVSSSLSRFPARRGGVPAHLARGSALRRRQRRLHHRFEALLERSPGNLRALHERLPIGVRDRQIGALDPPALARLGRSQSTGLDQIADLALRLPQHRRGLGKLRPWTPSIKATKTSRTRRQRLAGAADTRKPMPSLRPEAGLLLRRAARRRTAGLRQPPPRSTLRF